MSAPEGVRLIDGAFVLPGGRAAGVTAERKRGRWVYRSASTGGVLASGMTPAAFVRAFWMRSDFIESEVTA